MTKYRLNHAFKRFSGHYFYVIALVSTGLFGGRATINVKAATTENATPTSDATETLGQSENSAVLQTTSTQVTNSIKEQSAGSESQESGLSTEVSSTTVDTTKTAISDPNNPAANISEPTDNSSSSTGTSIASVTITPADGRVPIDEDATPPDTGNSGTTASPVTSTVTPTTITVDPQNATEVASDSLGVKPVGSIKLNVPVPTDGKDAIQATNEYYYTIDGDINIYNQMANYHGSLKDASEGAWQGSDYAAKISTTANGIDPATKQYYIDEWMPDIWFQYLLWTTQYSTQYQSWTAFKTTFSKSSLSNLTDFTVTTSSQQTSSTDLTPTLTYTALVQTQSLEGLQYAQNLNTINFTVNSNVSKQEYGGDIQSHLWDISALGKISSLRSVRFIDTSIQDISALRDNPLLNNLELSFNQISDISGFVAPWTHVNSPGNPLGSARYSSISMPLLVLKPGTTSVEVSYNVKGADGSLSHMIPSDGYDFGIEVWGRFKASTADAVSEDNHTIVFYNLLTPPAGNVGWLSAAHTFYMDGNDGSAFDVWVFIPYIISDNYGTTNVNYENLLPNGQQEEIATSTPLSGPVNNAYNISTDPNTTYPFEWLTDKYGSNYLVLDGTGNYSDFVANNGLAKAVSVSGTYTADSQNLTVLFAPTTKLTVQRGYYQPDGQFISLTTDTQVDQDLTTTLVVTDQVTEIPNFQFKAAELLAADGSITPVTTPTIPYLPADNQLRLVYDADQITVPVTYIDNLGHVIHPAATFTGTAIDTISSSSTTSQLPIPDYTFDHYEMSDGTPITTAVSLADLKDGLQLVYTGNDLNIPVHFIDDLGNPLQTSQITGAVNATLPENFTTEQQISIPDYTFSKIETTDHQPIPADATYNTIRAGINVIYQGNTISIPVQIEDVNHHALTDGTTFTHAVNSPFTPEQLTDLLPAIKYHSFQEVQDKAGNRLTLPVSIASIRDGIQLIYSEDTISANISYIDNDGNSLAETTMIQGKPSQDVPFDSLTIPELPGYSFDKFIDHEGNTVTLPTTIGAIADNGLTAVFQPIKVTVPVQIVDTDNQQIGDYQAINGNYLDELTEEKISQLATPISGYTFVEAQDINGNPLTLPVQLGTLALNGIKLIYSENSASVTIEYVDPAGNTIQPGTVIEGRPSEQLTDQQITVPELPGYIFDHFEDNNGNPLSLPITIGEIINGGLQVVYRPVKVAVSIYYVDEYGQTIANTQQVPGNYQDPFTADSVTALQQFIPGYTFSRIQGTNGTPITLPNILGQLQNGIYLVYTANIINVTPPVTPPAENPTDTSQEKVTAKIIYAMKQLSLHSDANFTVDNIIMTYVKKPRIYRPRFVILGTARDSQNRLRYLVRDINVNSDTYGLVGYVTANAEFVRSAYYHSVPTTITVINPKGINGYATADLTGKLTHYRQGTVLKVASIILNRTATRFVLTNGQIVTASKLLVKMGSIPQPKRATKIGALNRYSDLNLSTKTEHFKQTTPRAFTIINWDYNNGNNYHVKSLKRYQIKDGYITAYSKLVKSNY